MLSEGCVDVYCCCCYPLNERDSRPQLLLCHLHRWTCRPGSSCWSCKLVCSVCKWIATPGISNSTLARGTLESVYILSSHNHDSLNAVRAAAVGLNVRELFNL